ARPIAASAAPDQAGQTRCTIHPKDGLTARLLRVHIARRDRAPGGQGLPFMAAARGQAGRVPPLPLSPTLSRQGRGSSIALLIFAPESPSPLAGCIDRRQGLQVFGDMVYTC